jgi:hypothetical protein
MAIYDLLITSELPMSPALRARSGRRYGHRNAAFRALRAVISEAMIEAGLQDQPIAHELMRWADEAERGDALSRPGWIATNHQAPFAFLLTRRR